jgi:competence protein ComGC
MAFYRNTKIFSVEDLIKYLEYIQFIESFLGSFFVSTNSIIDYLVVAKFRFQSNKKESFFGFTNLNMMVVYFIIVLLLCFTNLISYNHNTDNEIIAKQNEEINSLKEQIGNFKTDNPKIAKKYFTE